MQSLPKGMRFGFTALVLDRPDGSPASSACAAVYQLSPQPQPSPPPGLYTRGPSGGARGWIKRRLTWANHRMQMATTGSHGPTTGSAWTDGWLTRTGSWRRAWRYG